MNNKIKTIQQHITKRPEKEKPTPRFSRHMDHKNRQTPNKKLVCKHKKRQRTQRTHTKTNTNLQGH